MSIILDFVTNMGLEVIKEKILDAGKKKQAKDKLVNYLSKQQKLNFEVSRDEEIDFAALANYIMTNLMDDATTRLFGNGKERAEARQRIIDKSIAYAKAHTKLSVKRTIKIVSTSMDILAKYYKSKINRELLFVTSEIQETINSEHQETRNHILDETDKIIDRITNLEKKISSKGVFSFDSEIYQINSGNTKPFERNLSDMINLIRTRHVLYPYYQFALTKDFKLYSQPLNAESAQKYPQNIKIQASSVRLGQKNLSELNYDILNQAYRHQQSLYIDVKSAEQFLGKIKDPSQNIAEQISGKRILFNPKEFPPAFPCYVTVDKNIIVPYLLLRTKEILDDNSYIITNEEQKGFPYIVKIHLYPNDQQITYMAKTISNHNEDHLKMLKCIRHINKGSSFSVNLCERNMELVSGKVNNCEFNILDTKITFLEDIIKIEKYFNINIMIPEEIFNKDFEILQHICSLINGDVKGTWKKFEAYFPISDEFKKNFSKHKNKESCMSYLSVRTFNLFGQEIKIPTMLSFKPAIISNFEKTLAKIQLCDDGDDVKITFVPSNQNAFFTEKIYEESFDS